MRNVPDLKSSGISSHAGKNGGGFARHFSPRGVYTLKYGTMDGIHSSIKACEHVSATRLFFY